MTEVLATSFILVFGFLVVALSIRSFGTREKRFVVAALALHFAVGVTQVILARSVYGGGDHVVYLSEGSLLAHAMEIHPARFVRLWLALLFHTETHETVDVLGEGNSTGTMIAITAAFAFVFRYSLYGACLMATFVAFMGKLALYRVFRELFPESIRLRNLIAVFLMPSFLFWSAGIQKEAFVVAGIGPLWLGIHRILRGSPMRGALYVLIGIVPIGLLKPYTLFALTIAAAAWIGLDRLHVRQGRSGTIRVRPLYLVLAVLLAIGGVVALGFIYPNYSVDKVSEDLARHQRLGAMMTANMDSQGGGASAYAMGGEEHGSLQRQLLFAPLAVVTALFRPLPFEANNALAFFASLETFALTVLLIQALFRHGLRGFISKVMSTPVLSGSLIFSLLFGMGVGLATTNFGSLSRYRMPLIPFYASVVLVMHATASARKKKASPAKTPKGQPLRRQARLLRPTTTTSSITSRQ
jgi:hypothetical protein